SREPGATGAVAWPMPARQRERSRGPPRLARQSLTGRAARHAADGAAAGAIGAHPTSRSFRPSRKRPRPLRLDADFLIHADRIEEQADAKRIVAQIGDRRTGSERPV